MKPKLISILIFLFVANTGFAPDLPDLTDLIINGVTCGPHGSARVGTKEYDQNVFKNRFDFPKNSDFDKTITLEKMLTAIEKESGFTQNTAIEVEGYVYDVKKGGVETCNCKTNDPLFRDTHIEITLGSNKVSKKDRVIVEVTPRIRQIMEDQGVDWSTENLRATIKGKFIRVQGWLFFDISHRTESFADDPDDNIGRQNWRATSWEIHPITSMEIFPDDNPDFAARTTSTEETDPPYERDGPPTGGSDATKTKTTKKTDMAPTSPANMLIIIVLGAILGMVGQGIRVVVGLKKMNDIASKEGISSEELFKTKQLVMSLFIAFAIGAIAGVLAAVTKINSSITQAEIVAFIAAGYAGTDFIEGFMKKDTTIVKNTSPTTKEIISAG